MQVSNKKIVAIFENVQLFATFTKIRAYGRPEETRTCRCSP